MGITYDTGSTWSRKLQLTKWHVRTAVVSILSSEETPRLCDPGRTPSVRGIPSVQWNSRQHFVSLGTMISLRSLRVTVNGVARMSTGQRARTWSVSDLPLTYDIFASLQWLYDHHRDVNVDPINVIKRPTSSTNSATSSPVSKPRSLEHEVRKLRKEDFCLITWSV